MTFKADQILGLDAFASNLGAEESITPLITLKGNSLRATLSPRSEQGFRSGLRVVASPVMVSFYRLIDVLELIVSSFADLVGIVFLACLIIVVWFCWLFMVVFCASTP